MSNFDIYKWNRERHLIEARLNEEKSKNDLIFDVFYDELEDFDGVAEYLNRYKNMIIRRLESIDFDYLPKPSMMEEGDSEDLISKLKTDPDNEYLTFTDKGDSISVGGRNGMLHDFILKYEDQDLGQYKLFAVDDEDRGWIVSLNKK